MDKEWFKDWFNTSYYHTLYKHRDESEAHRFIDHLCAYLKVKKGSKILDLACGKGRHALHLAKKGFQTTGVDLSEESINKAKEHAIENANFEVHDMRKTFIEKEFDYVFNLFTSFGYFEADEENLKVLKAAAANLKSEGIFVLDFLNVKKVIPNLIANEDKTIDGINFIINRTFNGKQIIKEILVNDGHQKHQFKEVVSALELVALEKMANSSGLHIINIFGNYKLQDFNSQNSDRLILLMQAEQK